MPELHLSTGKTQLVKKAEKKEEKQRETTVEFLASLAAVLVTGLFIITFLVQAFEIPSSSMEDTLLIGDHVFVNRVQFAPRTPWMPVLPYRDIRRGDLVLEHKRVRPAGRDVPVLEDELAAVAGDDIRRERPGDRPRDRKTQEGGSAAAVGPVLAALELGRRAQRATERDESRQARD